MRRFTPLFAAIAATFALGNAQALLLPVDNFNAPDRFMHDNLVGAGTFMSDGPAINLQAPTNGTGVPPYIDAQRQITHNWTVDGGGGNAFGSRSNVTIGGQGSPVGSLAMANAPGHNSIVDVQWTIAPNFVPAAGPVSFYFDVVFSDNVPVNISHSINGGAWVPLLNFSQAVPPAVTVFDALSAAEQAALNAGGTLALRFAGDAGWDLSIDSFGFDIPEPASLALAGLALIGAGVASRRRKAA